jgi:hypothetical protein
VVGAVVGAGVGAIVGSSLPPQPSVTYSQPVVVGQVLPQTVTVYPVPQYQQFDYTIINNHRVIIDPARVALCARSGNESARYQQIE